MEFISYFERAKSAAKSMIKLEAEQINEVLRSLAATLLEKQKQEGLLKENRRDLELISKDDPKYDRLQLTAERIESIAEDIEAISNLSTPINECLLSKKLENGLHLQKIRVPLGVVGVIYEARPNVTLDVFVLCFKTGNVTLLKGGSDAAFSNKAIHTIILEVLDKFGINEDVVMLLPPERKATEALLNASGYVDVLIPRGSQKLIDYVRNASRIPVIETGAGIVHTYFDKSADLQKGTLIIDNAKTRRVSVCNALDCLLIHQSRLNDLPKILQVLGTKGVKVYADEASYSELEGHYPENLLEQALPEHFGTEFLSMTLAVKAVEDIADALLHIEKYSSKHSEAIIAEDGSAIEIFLHEVDAAAVYANASTAFTDGAQFGLGAEIGISTQKLHARGPMGLEELTSYKWIIRGNGNIRA